MYRLLKHCAVSVLQYFRLESHRNIINAINQLQVGSKNSCIFAFFCGVPNILCLILQKTNEKQCQTIVLFMSINENASVIHLLSTQSRLGHFHNIQYLTIIITNQQNHNTSCFFVFYSTHRHLSESNPSHCTEQNIILRIRVLVSGCELQIPPPTATWKCNSTRLFNKIFVRLDWVQSVDSSSSR